MLYDSTHLECPIADLSWERYLISVSRKNAKNLGKCEKCEISWEMTSKSAKLCEKLEKVWKFAEYITKQVFWIGLVAFRKFYQI